MVFREQREPGNLRLRRLTLASLIAAACSAAFPIQAQNQDDPNYVDEGVVNEGVLEEVIVTGYRKSLEVALDVKKESVGVVDAVMAEDIADFPDTNLAEALQRIPGVAIGRSNGEGTTITVRGLGSRYTMTRINGMETRVGDAGNTGRGFSFNVFASELFNSIVVRKTAAADLQEGSLGSIVDLNTAHAFDYQEGMTAVIGGQASYNDLSDKVGPRFTGLYAWHDPSGEWGFTASAAWSQQDVLTATGNTVRWQKRAFNSVGGVNCTENPNDAGCAEVADGQHARIPRYGTNAIERDRLGLTAGFQWAPSDRTQLTVDAMYATYDTTTDFQTLEVLFRGNEHGMDITNYAIQPFPDHYGVSNNTIISMDVDNAWVRSENYHRQTETTFDQVSLAFDHEFSDTWRMNIMAGTTNSKDHMPVVTTLMYDDRDYNGYHYDYSQSTKYPVLSFNGPDVTDGSIYTLTELRDQVQTIKSGFDSFDLSAAWDFTDSDTLSAGYAWKKFTYDRVAERRDGQVCSLYPSECEGGTLGPQGSSAGSDPYTYPGEVGAGSNTSWAAPSISYWTDYFDYYNYPLSINTGSTNSVEEKSQSLWLMADGRHMLGDMNFLYNAGVRYVETDQSSTGYISGSVGTIDRPKYDDWLPAINTALWLTDDVVFRAAWAKTMARPALGQLVPGGTVDSFGFAINGQNPLLDPTRSTNWDFSIEWYFSNESVLSFAYFIKDIESFPISVTRIGTYASTGYPLSAIAPTSPASQNPEGECGNPEGCWEIRQLGNGPGAKLNGWELSLQTPFGELFGADVPVWRNMGMVANYTSVNSDVDYDYQGTLIVAPIQGLSENSYNLTLYYENEVFSTRLSWAHRSDYTINGSPNYQDNLWQYANGSTYLDFTSRYIFNEHWDMTFEILNLTDEAYSTEVDVDARRRFTYDNTGRNFLLGARYKF